MRACGIVAEPARPDPAPPPGRASGTLRALIVEDAPSVRAAVRVLLEGEGFEVVEVGSFDPAITAIRGEGYAVVVLDIQLGPADQAGQQGMVLLLQLRIWLPEAPVVVLSALEWSGEQVRDFLRVHGASDYLGKPADPDRLVAVIRELTARRR